MRSLGLLALIALSLPGRIAHAEDGEAENHLVEAVIAYRGEDWDTAFSELEAARAVAGSLELMARIERQAALLLVAVDRPVEALQAFRQAMALDPEIDLEMWRFGPGVRSLFMCAKRMDPLTPRPERLQSDGEGWICPVPEQTLAEVATATVSARPAVEERPPEAPQPTPVNLPAEPSAGWDSSPDRDRGSSLGALGGVGIGLIVAGLGGGVGVGGWQYMAREDAVSEVSRLNGLIAAGSGSAAITQAFNQAEQERADAERNAIVAASVGGGVALTGLVMLIVDLANGPGGAGDSARPEAAPLAIGPGFGSLLLRF